MWDVVRPRVRGACAIAVWALVAVALGCCIPTDSRAQSYGPGSTPLRDMVGVAAYQPTRADLEQMARIGVTVVRIDLNWAATERERGHYDFSAYRDRIRQIAGLGLRPMLVLAYGNPLYGANVETRRLGVAKARPEAPRDKAGVSAYASWAAAIAREFASDHALFEIWNEPDVDHWWPPRRDGGAYGRLLQAACARIHAASPHAIVVGPALAKAPGTAKYDPDFTLGLVRAGGLACADAISMHLYALTGDPAADGKLLGSIRAYMRTAGTASRPLYSSEWGAASSDLGEDGQGVYLARSLVVAVANGVRLNIWYNWQDRSTGYGAREDSFGLLRADGSPKPAYRALSTMLARIGDMKFACGAALPPDGFVALFRSDAGQGQAVYWGNVMQSPALAGLIGPASPEFSAGGVHYVTLDAGRAAALCRAFSER